MNRGIVVEVQTRYLAGQSEPASRRFAFSYTITIRNDGSEGARLLRRHWLITHGDGRTQEVRGEGVVGETPHLQPGQGFCYTSAAILETPVGSMHGSYLMMSDRGDEFSVPIPPFRLAMPGILH